MKLSSTIPPDMEINTLRQAYLQGELSPEAVFTQIAQQAEHYEAQNIWIYRLSSEQLQPYFARLATMDPKDYPLWGIPFAIKDNIDLAGVRTTAGCEPFAYVAETSATIVQKLIDAGAVPVGKTNLDQFATGLNGTRSAWGACLNSVDTNYISGGSSSGSAVAVALGLASFSLGTDTAGSGRVPAAFNHLVGLKPTCGLLSAAGVVPACKSLDTASIFAKTGADANTVLACAEGFDETDPYSRANTFSNSSRYFGQRQGALTIGLIPEQQLQFFGDEQYKKAYQQCIARLAGSDVELVEIDYAPFNEAALLLYEGPWVSERFIATESILTNHPDAMHSVVKDIVRQGEAPRATELFKAQYRLAALKQKCVQQLNKIDCLLTPTAGRLFTVDEMLEKPIERNSQLGYYTNFMNLLDMAALAVPTSKTEAGLPFGITLASHAFTDRALLSIAERIKPFIQLGELANQKTVKQTDTIEVLVCGAHLTDMPLNWQLTERGAKLKQTTRTAATYRLYALTGSAQGKPGLVADHQTGAQIEVEVWQIPSSEFGSFVADIPSPLGIGKVQLEDGQMVSGFICEPFGLQGAKDITSLGGWRNYQHSLNN